MGHGGYEQHNCYTRGLIPNGPSTWSIGALVDRGSNNGIARQYLFCSYSTATAAGVRWQDAGHGIRFDSCAPAGTDTAGPCPS